MVHGTNETMTEVFDTMSDAVRTSLEAGQRTQEFWFDAMKDMMSGPHDFNRFSSFGEKISKEAAPLVAKNIEVVADTIDSSTRAGMDVLKTACDVALNANEGDISGKNRAMWDASFSAVRTNMSAFTKMGQKTLENWATFCKDTCSSTSPAKSAPKPAPK